MPKSTRTAQTIALLLVVLAGVLPIASPTARADIFTYTDDEGVVHFTNIPPRRERGVRVVMRTRPARPDDAPRATGGTRDGSTERYTRYDAFIREAAALYRLPEAFIRAVIRVESDYHLGAISRVGAQGLMQLMPGTAAQHQVRDSFAARDNIEGGVRHLRMLLDRYGGNIPLTLAAYNAGQGTVENAGGVPMIRETREYLARVLRFRLNYLRESAGVLEARR